MKKPSCISIRKAQIEDVDSIVCCIASALDEFKDMSKSQHFFSKQALQDILSNEQIHYFIAELSAELVGVIAYKQPAHIYHFFVYSTMQGKGVGKQLFNFVMDEIKRSGMNVITVNASLNSVETYEKIGFIQKSGIESIEDMKFVRMEMKIQ